MADVRTSRFELDGFRGRLLHPGDDGYDEARKVFNAMIDRSPALVARCASADDVAAVVKLAGAENLPLSVYGGGHGVTGSAVCDAGLCVDLRGMKGIEVDAAARTIRAEAGLTWGEVDAATQEHGLAVTGGRMCRKQLRNLAGGAFFERVDLLEDVHHALRIVTALI